MQGGDDDDDDLVHISSPNNSNNKRKQEDDQDDSKKRPFDNNNGNGGMLRITTEGLKASSVSKLRSIASDLNIDLSRCLEKGEIVTSLITSGKIELIPTAALPGQLDLD